MKKETISNVNGDILSLILITDNIGWVGVKRISIYRILYLSSVLYSFRYPNNENLFTRDYVFVISLQGPYSDIIDKSLIYLETNEFIDYYLDEDIYKLGSNTIPKEIVEIPYFNEKNDWLNTIIYILGIYGEEKIYDFIFRDPEYQSKVQSNSIKEINIDIGNKTCENLIRFKEAFENKLGNEIVKYNMDDKEYLELYFRYVFSRILKGEMN
jgi:hypothetical protein